MELLTVFAALVVALIALGILYMSVKIEGQKRYLRKKRIPFYHSWPFTGIARKVFLRQITMMEYSDYLYNLHPGAKYIGAMDFSTPMIIVRDPEMIKHVTVKSFDNFTDHRPFIDETTDPLFGKNIFMLKGDRWRAMRNTLTPSFTANKMRFLFELVSTTAKRFVGYLAEHPEMTGELETKDAFTRYTNDVVATAAFGISINSVEDRNNEFLMKGKEVASFGGNLGFIKMILIRVVPWFCKVTNISLFSKATLRFFNGVISETLRVRREKGIVRPDMIHLLMQASDKDSPLGRPITTEDIVAQAFGFFLAGFDTTSTFMCCMVHELAVNQDIQDRVCEEIERVLEEHNNELSYESLSKMEYLEMVMSEALRKYSPVVFIDRMSVNDLTIPAPYPGEPDVKIEKDTVILFPVHSLHMDPKYFPEPEKFDPERFSEKNKDKIVPYSYLPFGAGPRKCIGNRFVLMEAKLLMIHLLRTFKVTRTEKTVHPIVFSKKAFAPLAENGFWIRLEKKEAS